MVLDVALVGLTPADLPLPPEVAVRDGHGTDTGAALRALDAGTALDVLDAVVVGPAGGSQVTAVQHVHALAPEASLVVLLPPGDPAGVRRALRYSPGVPAEIELVEGTGPDAAHRVVEAAQHAALRRRHRTLLAAVAAQPRRPTPAPSAGTPLGALLDHAPLGVLVIDPDGLLLSWNRRAAGLLRIGRWETGTPLTGYLADPDAARDALARIRAGEVSVPPRPVAPLRRADLEDDVALELSAVATRLDDGRPAVLVLLVDVTGRRAAEAARDLLSARLLVVRRSQEFLLRASDVLATVSGYEDTLEQLARVSVPTLGDLCLIDVLDDDRRLRRVAVAAADEAHAPLARELKERYAPRADSTHPAATALVGHTRWSATVTPDWLRRQARDERHLQILEQLGVSGYITVPLVADGEVLGTVSVVLTGTARRFGPDDVALAEELAGRVARVVAKERRYDQEHRIAEALQRSMLTRLPRLPGLELASRYVPARQGTHVGGDWYDAFAFPGEDPVVVIGDVVGHDLEASARMGALRNALRGLAHGRSGGAAAVLTALDALTTGLGVADLASVLYGVLEPGPGGGRRLRWSNAGHLPPLLLVPGAAARFLEHEADPLVGAGHLGARSEHVVDVPPGATVLLYTDGLVEDRAEQLERGPGVLADLATRLSGAPLEELCDAALGELGRDSEDDIALLAVRVLPAG
ncbi:hypothetical protein NUM3379_28920 [Kineococcus sp. NUM-3379]